MLDANDLQNMTRDALRNLAKDRARSEKIPLTFIGQSGTTEEHKAYLSGTPYAQAYPKDPKNIESAGSAPEVDAGSEPLQPVKDQEQITDTGPTDQDALDEEDPAPSLKLAPNHLEDLRKSGLTDATISKAGIESIRPCDISRILGYESTEIESIYRIPFDANYSRFKLFYKTAAAPGHKRPKYIQPRGSINRLYIPPTFPQSELKSLSTIRIVEGEKKTLKAIQEGIIAIGITGLWNWKSKDTDEMIPDFEQFTITGRKFEIVPDSDWLDLDKDDKPKNLKQAVYRLATALMLKGAIVGIVALPKSGADKVGLDDYLLDHTKADFEELECKAVSARSCFRNTAYFLYYHEFDRDKEKYKHPLKVASAISVMAFSRNHSNESWGLMLRLKDADKKTHDWAMPKEMLGCDIGLVCKKLLNSGLPYISAARPLLQEYLMTARPDKNRRVRCVDRTGWHGGLFVLPKRTLGRFDDEETIYQGTCPSVISSKGTAEEWRDKIGRYCSGNSRLLFAISMSLAAPLLHIVGAENRLLSMGW